ncbi:SRPBCC family protein [Geodermatophilus sp. SYSU D00703]
MTSSQQSSSGGLAGVVRNNPVVSQLGDAAKQYAKARGQDAVRKVGEKLSGVTDSMNQSAEDGGFKATAASAAVKRVVQGESPLKAAIGGVGAGIKESVKGLFGRKKGGGAGGNKKFMNIIEDVTVGVPVNVAYDQWTQFQEFASFMKGVDSVDPQDEVHSNWRVKVAKSRRNWKATITEAIPDRKIAWTTEGGKGTTKGVVTFHPLADDLTQILLVMEYYPQGLFEKTGNIWRAQGRRTRLDLKHFRRFVTMRGEATGSWRGEIRDAEVVRGPDEEEEPQDRAALARGGEEEEQAPEEEGEEAYGEEEPEEAEEGEYAEGEAEEGEYAEGEAEEGEYAEGEAEEGEYEGEEEEGEEPEEEQEPELEDVGPRSRRGRRREPAGSR